jgi:hypothetical protein
MGAFAATNAGYVAEGKEVETLCTASRGSMIDEGGRWRPPRPQATNHDCGRAHQSFLPCRPTHSAEAAKHGASGRNEWCGCTCSGARQKKK